MSDHPRGRIVGWLLLALAGLAIAVALSVTASNLSTQPIGLSGEPLRAGDRLAPTGATTSAPAKKKRSTPRKPTATAPTQAAPVPTTTSGSSGSSGSSGTGVDSDDHGGNRNRDGDDD